jgi:hypothetical protein
MAEEIEDQVKIIIWIALCLILAGAIIFLIKFLSNL